MKTFKTILGVILALAGLFAGGCGLYVTAMSAVDAIAGRPHYNIWIIGILAGIVPGIIGGLVARWAFASAKKMP